MSELDDWTDQVAEEQRQSVHEELAFAWNSLLNHAEGRRVLQDLRLTCRPGISPLCFDGMGHIDEKRTFVRIGHMEVWWQLLARMGLTYEQLSEKLVAAQREET